MRRQPAGREFADAVRALLVRADELEAEGLAGYVYTQLSDVEEETQRPSHLRPARAQARIDGLGCGSKQF